MTIEFADPGLDWSPMWGVGIVLAVAFLTLFVGIVIEKEYVAGPGFVLMLIALVTFVATPLASYDFRIRDEEVAALERSGFESVSLSGDRFTADMNGRFYRGVLVDLAPESGYAYRVLELTDTKETP